MAISSLLLPVIIALLGHLPLILGVSLLLYILRQRYFHPLSSFPGPFLASITPLWIALQTARGKSHTETLSLHRHYGPVFRNGPNSLSFSSPRALDPIYGHRPRGNEFHKSEYYFSFTPTTTDEEYNVFTSRFPEQHAGMRKRVAGVYALKNLLERYEGTVDGCVQDWVARIAGLAKERESGGVVDFAEWSHYLPLDVISEVAYGNRVGFIEKAVDVENYQQILREGFIFLSIISYLPTLTKIMKSSWLGPWLNPSPQDKNGYGALLGVAEKIATDRLANGNTLGKPHLVHSFAAEVNDAEGNPLPKGRVLGETMVTILGGSDSTAIAILACVYYVSRHPEVQRKLSEEIREFEERGMLSDPIQYSEAVGMPYLQAIIKEAMRLYPSFGGNWPRVTAEGGYEILPGIWVPGGVDVGVCAYVSNRDPATFGEDAEDFRPERWLPLDSERSKEFEKLQCTFGYTYSSRVCIGKNLSMIELYKSLTAIFRRFDVKLQDPALRLEDIDTCHIQMIVGKMPMIFTEKN